LAHLVDEDVWSIGGMWQSKPTYQEKNLSQRHLSTTSITWTDLGSNPGVGGERPAINADLNYKYLNI